MVPVERPDEDDLDDDTDERPEGDRDNDRDEESDTDRQAEGRLVIVSQPAYAPAIMNAPWAKLRTPMRP